ncbi:unnamed protein product, partial [Scytosiphon promiscuus]
AVESSSDPASPANQPRAISLNALTTIKGEVDPILTNIATGAKARWSTVGQSDGASTTDRPLPKISKQCLPRGGTYLSTIVGPIQAKQVGMPPETIKDSMDLGLPVPQYYVMPPETFCRTLGNSLGINVAEFEFPAYYNFFLKGQTMKLVVDSVETENRVRALMQETLLGPEQIDATIDFDKSVPPEDRPDIAKELAYFRSFNGKELSVDLLITFLRMNSEGVVTIGGADGTSGADYRVTIASSDSEGGEYVVTEHRREEKSSSDEVSSLDRRHDEGAGVSDLERLGSSTSDGSGRARSEDGSSPRYNERSAGNSGRGERRSGLDVEEERRTRHRAENLRHDTIEGVNRLAGSRDEVQEGAEKGRPGSDGVTRPRSPSNRGNKISLKSQRSPTPPERKPSSSSRLTLDRSGPSLGPSAVTRFARWIVESAHIGGKKLGRTDGSGGEIHTDERSTAASRDTRKSRTSIMRSSFVGLKGQAVVEGFVPARMVRVSMTCPLPTKQVVHPNQTEEEFDAPTFGTTVLGNSHGFDPKGNTSGYVLWINGRGYMIDPPPYASAILKTFNIRPSLIAGVIVTHCHADHDAGTFQKVLLDGQVNIISTRTIYESFIRKYTALSGMSGDLIRSSHSFTPVTIGQTLRLNGASFDFFYTLHSIPCVGFEVVFKGKGMAFSADHMNDPARIRAMCEDGFMSKGRRDALLRFPWHHDIIFHEAGIPPIHTPMGTLQELPDDVKKRLYVVHVSESSIPKGSGLKVAPVGVESTIRLETAENPHRGTINLLELICSVGVLSDISVAQARSLLEVGQVVKFEGNTTVQHPNIDITSFAIICKGKASSTMFKEVGTRRSFGKQETVLRRGDCYGEELLLEGSVRRRGNASVRAVSKLEVLLFNGQDLDQILGLQSKRLEDTYRLDRLLVYNTVLCSLSRKQMLQLETFTEVKNFAAGEMVWTAGQPVERVVLVAKGKLAFVNAGVRELMSGSCPRDGQRMTGGEKPRLVFCPKAFLPGSLIGRAGTIFDPPGSNHYQHSLRVSAWLDVGVVLVVSREDMTSFSYYNPGVFMAIHDLQFVC